MFREDCPISGSRTTPTPPYPAGMLAPTRQRVLPLLGPAFVASIAYVDPGNVATGTQAGSRYGTLLLWVVVTSNGLAMLVQYLSAKLGLATGSDLPNLCRGRYRRAFAIGLWVQAELVAMATDLAEVVGGAIALQLLFGLPLLVGGIVTGLVSFILLGLTRRGHRPFERAVLGLLAVVLTGFVVAALGAGVHPADVASGLLPRFAGSDSVILAAGLLGATVMPHAVYVHSRLLGQRADGVDLAGRRGLLRAQAVDIPVAMGLAAVVNVAILLTASSVFHDHGVQADTIQQAHAGLRAALGPGIALCFALALLASGLASSSVGTLSGQIVMSGFLGITLPVNVRRLITLLPAVALLAVGVDATTALIDSQVVLSFGLPFALVPLVLLTRDAEVMGGFVNRRVTTVAATVVVALVVALDAALLGPVLLPPY